MNWGQEKGASSPLILVFLDSIIQTIASLSKTAESIDDLLTCFLLFVVIRLLPVIFKSRCHKTFNFYIFQKFLFYKLMDLFSVIHSERNYWAKLKISVMAFVWRAVMS